MINDDYRKKIGKLVHVIINVTTVLISLFCKIIVSKLGNAVVLPFG